MDWSIFAAVLNDVRDYMKQKTRVALYVPILAFLGAWVLVLIGTFGFEAPKAFWLQLSGGVRVILIGVLVFSVLIVAYLASHLSILVTRLYQGRWPQWLSITHPRRMRYLDKWRSLVRQSLDLDELSGQITKLWKAHWPDPPKLKVPVLKRPLPAWHLIRQQDLGFKQLTYEDAEAYEQDADKLVGCYTLEPLSSGGLISQSQIRAQPWHGYLDEKSVVSVPISPHSIVGLEAGLPGELVDIVLTPKPWASRKTKMFRNVLVFDVGSAQDVVVGSEGNDSRELVVLVVALGEKERTGFADLLAGHDVNIHRRVTGMGVLERCLPGRVLSSLSLNKKGVEYDLPQEGVSIGDIIDIEGVLSQGGEAIPLEGCFVDQVTSKELRIAIPKKFKGAYDQGAQAKKVKITHSVESVFVLTRDVKEGEFLSESDLSEEERRIAELPAGVVKDKANLVNHRVVTALTKGRCILEGQVEEVEVPEGRAQEYLAAGSYVIKNQVEELGILEGKEIRDFPLEEQASSPSLPDTLQNEATCQPQSSQSEHSEPIEERLQRLLRQAQDVFHRLGEEMFGSESSPWHWLKHEDKDGEKIDFKVSPGEVVDITTSTTGNEMRTYTCFVCDVKPDLLRLTARILEEKAPEEMSVIGIEHVQVWKDLLMLEKRFKKLRNDWDEFMTMLFSDGWPDEKMWDPSPLLQFASDMDKLAQEVAQFGEKWPGANTVLNERWNALNEDQFNKLVTDLLAAVDTRQELVEKQIRLYFPTPRTEEVMPTELGNILKSVELYPESNYGFEADIIWPRLKEVLDEQSTQALATRKDKLDMLLLMSFMSLIFWPLACAVLALFSDNGWAFLLCAVGAPLLAWLCYRAAIQAALDYGEHLKSIYDFHRLELLRKLNLELPDKLTIHEERDWWAKINELFIGRPTSRRWSKTKYKITDQGDQGR